MFQNLMDHIIKENSKIHYVSTEKMVTEWIAKNLKRSKFALLVELIMMKEKQPSSFVQQGVFRHCAEATMFRDLSGGDE